MKVYTDPRIFDLSGAVEKLPITLRKPNTPQLAKATGTSGHPIAPDNPLAAESNALVADGTGRSEKRQ
jgi:hypothetical protein